MALKLQSPVEKIVPLVKCDSSGDTLVSVRQATKGVVDKLEDLRTAGTEYSWNDEEHGKMHMKPSKGAAEIRRSQVFWTMSSCNIIDENGQPLFQSMSDGNTSHLVMDEVKFQRAWDKLPPDVADEIFDAVVSINTQWAVRGE